MVVVVVDLTTVVVDAAGAVVGGTVVLGAAAARPGLDVLVGCPALVPLVVKDDVEDPALSKVGYGPAAFAAE